MTSITTSDKLLLNLKKTSYNRWQPTAEQRFWEVVERSASGLNIGVTVALTSVNI